MSSTVVRPWVWIDLSGSIGESNWTGSAGGESAFLAFDPNNPRYVMGGSYQGTIEVIDTKAEAGTNIMAAPIQYLGMDAAITHCTAGIGIWEWASNDREGEPDAVLACCGDVPTLETLAAALARWDFRQSNSESVRTFFRAAPGGVPSQTAFSQDRRYDELDLDRIADRAGT